MKALTFSLLLPALLIAAPTDAARRANLVILDDSAVKNLRLTTVPVAPADFEETVFALGRIEVMPGRRSVVSSRIAGRAIEVRAVHDHEIAQGEVAVVIESRQFGEPPPRLELTSPISGTISATHVVPGQPIEPNDVLVEVLDLTDVYALARVPDHLASRLRQGQAARITSLAVPGPGFDAKLEHLGVIADPENGTVEAAFRVKNPTGALLPGMRAEFSIVTAKHTGVTSVPRSAIQGEGANRFVYVRDFEVPNGFLKTPVVLGRSNDRVVEIVSGLFPEDEVVTQGAYSLAFAGGGTLSLKDALDAAHGHAHNADGSEVSANANSGGSADGHSHTHGHLWENVRVWMGLCAVLFAGIIVLAWRLRQATAGHRNDRPHEN